MKNIYIKIIIQSNKKIIDNIQILV